jgi:hypothetical protein
MDADDDLRTDEKQRQAAALRLAGVEYSKIAEQLGYASASGAYHAAQAGLTAAVDEPKSQIRALELRRLDEMLVGLWRKARGGDLAAVDRVLKVMERRARYLTLDGVGAEPATTGESDFERAQRLRRERQAAAKAKGGTSG